MTMYTEHDLRRALSVEAAAAQPRVDSLWDQLQARRARQRRRQAVAATLSVLVVAGAVLGIAVVGRPGRLGPSARPSYQQLCAREPDVCLRAEKGTLPAGVSRPLHLPGLAPGAPCPVTTGRESTSRYVGGLMFGAGPVRMIFGDQGHPARGVVELGTPGQPPWLATTSTLLVSPTYRGPVLLRGHRLDGPGTAFFDGTTVSSYVDPPNDANTESDGSRTPPASVFVHSAGCYGFQIDGTTFSETVVVNLDAPPRTG